MVSTDKQVEVMQDFKLKAQSAQLEITSAIYAAKSNFDDQSQKIRSNPHYTQEGRGHQLNQLRTDILADIIAKADKLRTEYDEANTKAREVAREILTKEGHEKPSDGEVALFQRELTQLKTKLMLEMRYNSALELVRSFETKYQDGYYAAAMLDQMPTFIETIVGLAENKDEARSALRRMHSALEERAKTDGQRAAEQTLEYESQFISRAGMEYRVLNDLFGAATAYRLTK